MAKSKPIGVRFDEKVLERFRGMEINSPQKALNFMEGLFMRTTDDIGKIVSEKLNTDELGKDNPKDNKTQAKEVKKGKNEALVSNIKFSRVTTSSFDGKDVKPFVSDEFGQMGKIVDTTLSDADRKEITQQIAETKAELKSPPKSPTIGLKRWTQIREDKIAELENKLK